MLSCPRNLSMLFSLPYLYSGGRSFLYFLSYDYLLLNFTRRALKIVIKPNTLQVRKDYCHLAKLPPRSLEEWNGQHLGVLRVCDLEYQLLMGEASMHLLGQGLNTHSSLINCVILGPSCALSKFPLSTVFSSKNIVGNVPGT